MRTAPESQARTGWWIVPSRSAVEGRATREDRWSGAERFHREEPADGSQEVSRAAASGGEQRPGQHGVAWNPNAIGGQSERDSLSPAETSDGGRPAEPGGSASLLALMASGGVIPLLAFIALALAVVVGIIIAL